MSAPTTKTWRRASLAAGGVRGCVLRADDHRAVQLARRRKHLDAWLKARGIIAITGVDTRALTALIREKGMPNAVIAHAPDGKFDLEALKREAAAWPGMVGLDLAKDVTCRPELWLGRDRSGSGARAMDARRRRASMSSPSIMG